MLMSARTQCPACGGRDVGRVLDFPENLVAYVRCGACNHVWNVPKGQEGPIKNVTPLPKKEKPALMSAVDLFAYAERALGRSRQLRADTRSLSTESSELARQAHATIDSMYRLWERLAAGNADVRLRFMAKMAFRQCRKLGAA